MRQQEESKPLLKILKFDQTAAEGDLHSHIDNSVQRSRESNSKLHNMVSKDLSPLSPNKKAFIGD